MLALGSLALAWWMGPLYWTIWWLCASIPLFYSYQFKRSGKNHRVALASAHALSLFFVWPKLALRAGVLANTGLSHLDYPLLH